MGIAAAVVVLVVFALEQAGGGSSGPLDAIAAAAEATQREPGGHALVNVTVTASGTPEGITETGPIVFENGGRARGTLVVRGHTTGRPGHRRRHHVVYEVRSAQLAAGRA